MTVSIRKCPMGNNHAPGFATSTLALCESVLLGIEGRSGGCCSFGTKSDDDGPALLDSPQFADDVNSAGTRPMLDFCSRVVSPTVKNRGIAASPDSTRR